MARRRKKRRDPALASHVASSVETIAAIHERAQREVGPHVLRISRVTERLGRPSFLAGVVGLVTAWITYNLAAPALGTTRIDPPPFVWLQGAVALAALLMTTLVLIAQNRQSRHAEQRARLDLQINLVAEQKITKVIELLEDLRRDMPNVHDHVDEVAKEMREPADATAVLDALEKTIDASRITET